MRNIVSGVIGIALGGLILVNFLLSGGPQGQGAYRAGQIAALIFGAVCLLAGVYYLVKGLRGESRPKRRRKRRPAERDDE